MRGSRFGVVAVAGLVAAMLAAPAEALPHEDRAVLSASVATSAAKPRVLQPGRSGTVVVVTNIGRTPTKALRAKLVRSAGGERFRILFDSCTLSTLKPRRKCRVRVGYAGVVAPEAAATAVLRVIARGKAKVATATYFRVEARQRFAPTADGESYTVGRGGSLSVGAPGVLANDRDPDSRSLTAVLVEGVKHGTLTLSPNGAVAYRPDPAYVGPDSFVYRAVDGDGLGAWATVSITVAGTNRPPVAVADAAAVTEDAVPSTAAGNLLTNDSDPDGDPLTATVTAAPTHGTLALDADGSYTYTLDNGDAAVDALEGGQTLTDTATYTVSDGHGGTASASLTITINGTTDNGVPVATADVNTVKEDAAPNPISGNVLTNDSDPDADTLAVVGTGTFTGLYGVLVISGGGSYTYTLDNSNAAVNALNNGQTLTDAFNYTVSDGHGGTASATLTITINGTTD